MSKSEPSTFATLRVLLRSRLALGAAAVLVALAIAGGALPLLEVPGYELGLAAALASALFLGPSLGIAAARLELARDGVRPHGVLRPFTVAAGTLLALLALLLAASTVRAALATPCHALA